MPDLLVNIDVDDLEAATAFYCGALGLQVTGRFEFGVEISGAGSPIYLLARPEGSLATPAAADIRHYGRHWTPVHLDFVVGDLDAAVARALAHGATQERPASTAAWGRLALMADPFGHGFCLVQFLGRGYDEIAVAPSAGEA